MMIARAGNRAVGASGHRCGWAGSRATRPCLPNAAHRSTQVWASATPLATQLGTEGLVLSKGEAGSWDEAGVGSPVVRCYFGDNEERWVMWYSGRSAESKATDSVDTVAPSAGSAGVAISGNGVSWLRGQGRITGERGEGAAQDVGMVLEPNGDWWWFDTCHVQVSDVQILSNSSVSEGVGVFWMLYSGGDFHPADPPKGFPGIETETGSIASADSLDGGETTSPSPSSTSSPSTADSNSNSNTATDSNSNSGAAAGLEGFRMRPGLAMSQDGRNWARIEADHHSGALFDVGAPGEWDAAFIGTPQLLAAGPRDMRMFYHSYDSTRGRFVVGMAQSPDGFKWAKKGVVFDPAEGGKLEPGAHDFKGAAALQVVRDIDNRQFVMFYEAVAADNRRSIGMAVSKDGKTNWQRCPYPILTAAGAGAGAGEEQGKAEGRVEAWDEGAVGQPCGVSMSQGKWRLYYAGRKSAAPGPFEGIGVALSVEGGTTFQGMPSQFKRRAASMQE